MLAIYVPWTTGQGNGSESAVVVVVVVGGGGGGGGANVIHLFRCVFIVWSLADSQPITNHLLQATSKCCPNKTSKQTCF